MSQKPACLPFLRGSPVVSENLCRLSVSSRRAAEVGSTAGVSAHGDLGQTFLLLKWPMTDR